MKAYNPADFAKGRKFSDHVLCWVYRIESDTSIEDYRVKCFPKGSVWGSEIEKSQVISIFYNAAWESEPEIQTKSEEHGYITFDVFIPSRAVNTVEDVLKRSEIFKQIIWNQFEKHKKRIVERGFEWREYQDQLEYGMTLSVTIYF